ncbi:MAG: TIGR04190 family B12-binding domain/radical SAM domain protein [Candidatus Hydrothermarchaeota archaeon]
MSDLILLHPPSVYDFRDICIFYGPVSDLIPSTPIFEMYPIGFISIAEYLERHGYRVKIVNIAAKMLKDNKFNVEKLIKGLDSQVFGIDLHWLPHAQGSLEIARIIKKYHPNSKIVMGGLSSSYFHTEIIDHQVDYILRGDSTEKPFLMLLDCIEKEKKPENVPNLTWKDDGKKKINPISHVPESLDDLMLNPEPLIKSVIRDRDMNGYIPFKDWIDYPLTAVFTCRGCLYNCVTCGGSKHFYSSICMREKIALRSPDKIAEDMAIIQDYIQGPIFIVGDLFQGGNKYAENVLNSIKKENIENPVVVEFFKPPSDSFLEKISRTFKEFYLQISPESHDYYIRRNQGRNYGNKDLEKAIKKAIELGCSRIDVFFMIGIPGQTMDSVYETVEYCAHLIELDSYRSVRPFISPLAPFLDPGSLAYENPAKFGYKLFLRSLEDHRRALLNPSWKHTLNYETKWLKKEDIVKSTYESAIRLNRIKMEKNVINQEEALEIEERILLSRNILYEIDNALKFDGEKRENKLSELKSKLEEANKEVLCPREELKFSKKAKIKKINVLKSFLRNFR